MRIYLSPGESGGHGHSMQSSACRDSIGYFGTVIVGSTETGTGSPDIAHYRRYSILESISLVGHLARGKTLCARRMIFVRALHNDKVETRGKSAS
jgi:hypothetical protein